MFDQRALTLGTPRRVSASSITSSWYSEPMWTSSTAVAPVTASSARGPGSERRIGGTEGQGRPEPLASGRDQMTGHLAEEAVLGVDLVGQTGLDPGQVAGQGFEADILEEAHARPLSALVDGSTPGSAPLRSLRPASPWAGPLGPRLRCSLMPQSYRRDRT